MGCYQDGLASFNTLNSPVLKFIQGEFVLLWLDL